MKKSLIALVVSGAFTAGASADVKLYGKFNVSIDAVKAEAVDEQEYQMTSHASRLGVKGEDDLGVAKVIYQMEFQVDVDEKTDKDGNPISRRNSYVGLTGNAGTVVMGYMDSPLKTSQGKFDLFNDVVDIKNIIVGENRLADQLNYTSPKMAGFELSASTFFKEAAGAGNGTSVSLSYTNGGFYASVAADDNSKEKNTRRFTAVQSFGDFRLGVIAQKTSKEDLSCEDCEDPDETGYGANISYKIGSQKIKLQHIEADHKAEGASETTLGIDHKMGRATKAYFFASKHEEDAEDTQVVTAGLGLIHKF